MSESQELDPPQYSEQDYAAYDQYQQQYDDADTLGEASVATGFDEVSQYTEVTTGSELTTGGQARAALYTNVELQDEAALFEQQNGDDGAEYSYQNDYGEEGADIQTQDQSYADGYDGSEWSADGGIDGENDVVWQQPDNVADGDAEPSEQAELDSGAAEGFEDAEQPVDEAIDEDVMGKRVEDIRRQLELQEVIETENKIEQFWKDEQALFQQINDETADAHRRFRWKKTQAALELAHEQSKVFAGVLKTFDMNLSEYIDDVARGNITPDDELIAAGVQVYLPDCNIIRVPKRLFDSRLIRDALTMLNLSGNCLECIPEQVASCIVVFAIRIVPLLNNISS